MKKVTIADIAQELSLSPVTISRALSGQPGVSSKLKAQILEKAKEMGYSRPQKGEPYKILVLYYKETPVQEASNLARMEQSIEKTLQEAGTDYFAEFIDSQAQKELKVPYHMTKSAAFDGVIFVGRFDPEYEKLIAKTAGSIVSFTGHSNSSEYDCVGFNIHNTGYKQCRYLIENGHRKIGFVSAGGRKNRDRLLGISTALEDYGISKREDSLFALELGHLDSISALFNAGQLPTAFVCDSDYTAMCFVQELFRLGLRIPDDISVIGSGNNEYATLSLTPLTTLDLNIEYCCELAVTTLIKRMERCDKPFESIEVISRLIERDSVKKLQ